MKRDVWERWERANNWINLASPFLRSVARAAGMTVEDMASLELDGIACEDLP